MFHVKGTVQVLAPDEMVQVEGEAETVPEADGAFMVIVPEEYALTCGAMPSLVNPYT